MESLTEYLMEILQVFQVVSYMLMGCWERLVVDVGSCWEMLVVDVGSLES